MQQHQFFMNSFDRDFSLETRAILRDCALRGFDETKIFFGSDDAIEYSGFCRTIFYCIERNIRTAIDSGLLGSITRIPARTDNNYFNYPEFICGKFLFHLKKTDHPGACPRTASMRENRRDQNQKSLFETINRKVEPYSNKTAKEKLYGILTFTHDLDGITSLMMGFPRNISEGNGWLCPPISLLDDVMPSCVPTERINPVLPSLRVKKENNDLQENVAS